ncbi:unnamed protein product [Gongylonema pulchrum]|uniref:2-isopropylmalate synthase n=1 Tax=Gongylonema pulchrum TaxID=637853 RepID=A0A183EX52_9BILA|nr:unnamed protein product [Gongylonema pulchrum]
MSIDASSINVKWDHLGVFRRFQIPLTDASGRDMYAPERDIYKELLAKINISVPDFNGKLGWKGNLA